MPARQIIKTNKRIVFLVDSASSATQIVGLTASAFYNLNNAEQLQQSLVSGITAGSACLSRVISGGQCTIEQRGDILFRTSTVGGEFNFERFTVRSITGGVTAAISVAANTAIVEFVVGHPEATQSIAL